LLESVIEDHWSILRTCYASFNKQPQHSIENLVNKYKTFKERKKDEIQYRYRCLVYWVW
jgi:hypothetical protein